MPTAYDLNKQQEIYYVSKHNVKDSSGKSLIYITFNIVSV